MKLTYELRPGIDQVGYVDYNVRDFHSYDTRLGATYNAYLIRDERSRSSTQSKRPSPSSSSATSRPSSNLKRSII